MIYIIVIICCCLWTVKLFPQQIFPVLLNQNTISQPEQILESVLLRINHRNIFLQYCDIKQKKIKFQTSCNTVSSRINEPVYFFQATNVTVQMFLIGLG